MAEGERHTALHDACIQGDAELIKALLKSPGQQSTVNETGVGGWCGIHYSARNGSAAGIKALIEAKALASLKTKVGDTPLHLAAEAGHVDVVRLLLDAKAMPSVEDGKGRTPVERTRSEEIKGLLAANETSAPSKNMSAAALLSQLQEMTQKMEVLGRENARLSAENEVVSTQNKQLAQEICEVSALKAVIVGCWDFKESQSFPPLPQVKKSCSMIRKALVSCGFSFRNITTLDNPTYHELTKTLSEIQSDTFSRHSSTVLVYIGSHTRHDALTKQSYLVLSDTEAHNIGETAVSMTQLSRDLSSCLARRQVLLFDGMQHAKARGEGLEIRDSALDELADRCPAALVITACSANQIAGCTPPHPDPQAESIFVGAIVSAIQGKFADEKFKADPRVQALIKDSASRGQVLVSQLVEYLNIVMQSQRPLYLNAASALRNDFPIGLL